MRKQTVGLALLLLAGCAQEAPAPPEQNESSASIKAFRLPDYTHVYEFSLSDGTRCVSTGYRGGVTCEWEKTK